jgi:hypothetical protein
MICHVCEQQAIGQCKKCGKFYCKQHGDVTCIVCETAVQQSPSRSPQEFDESLPGFGKPHHAAAPVYAGPRCYKCAESATAACAKCGQFYCGRHRGGTSFFDNTRGSWWQSGRVLCQDCLSSVDTMGMIGCVIAIIVMIVGGLIFMGVAAH